MSKIMRSWGFATAVLLIIGSMTFPSFSAADTVYNVNRSGVAIKGYDPVAYFTQKMPVKGSDMYELEWEGAKWRFASMANLDLFRGDPAKYAPRYGGYCAYGVAVGGLYNIKPEAWSIVDGTLYLNKNLRIRETWRKDIPGYIEKADANWPGLKGK
jgi:YHS domain-containing protein